MTDADADDGCVVRRKRGNKKKKDWDAYIA